MLRNPQYSQETRLIFVEIPINVILNQRKKRQKKKKKNGVLHFFGTFGGLQSHFNEESINNSPESREDWANKLGRPFVVPHLP